MRKIAAPNMVPKRGEPSVDRLSLLLYRAYMSDIKIEKATWYHLAMPIKDTCSLDVRQQASDMHDLFARAMTSEVRNFTQYSGAHEELLDASRSLKYARSRREQTMRALATSRTFRALDEFRRKQQIASSQESVTIDAATLGDGGYRLQVESSYADTFFGEPLEFDESADPDLALDPYTDGQWYEEDGRSLVVWRTPYRPGSEFSAGNPGIEHGQYQTLFPYMVRNLGQLGVTNS